MWPFFSIHGTNVKSLNKTICLDYQLPNGASLDLKLNTDVLLGSQMNKSVRRLLNCYEQDLLFINKDITKNITSYLQTKYNRDKSKMALDELRTIEPIVFSAVNTYLNKTDFSITANELMAYFNSILDAEFEQLAKGNLDSSLQYILASPQAKSLMRSLLTQFSIEFLIEGAPMGLYATGAYGVLQSHLLRVYQDEMGNGIPEDKHSYLYEKTMSDLGLSDIPNAYDNFYLTSNMLVSAYTYQLCHDKSKFLRYLGAFFRNEACFILWQKDLGESVRNIFNGEIDCRYFDVHTAVDQSHGRWVLNHLIRAALTQFGDDAAPEILRGFFELMIYQDIYGLELDHHLIHGVQAEKIKKGAVAHHQDQQAHALQTGTIFSSHDLLIDLNGNPLFLLDPLTPTLASADELCILPAWTAAHIPSTSESASYFPYKQTETAIS